MKPFWDLIEENLGADFAEDLELQQLVHELSLNFTEGRRGFQHDYLSNPEQQSAYLAYYVPLNFEKVHMILSSHAGVWAGELKAEVPQRWLDLGCGPGTATLAALAAFKNRYKKIEKLPAIHIDLVDNQTGALNLAETLVKSFAAKIGLTVTLGMHTAMPPKSNVETKDYDLTVAANVLNELPMEDGPQARELLLQAWDSTKGVMLVLEPGHRVSSQRLVRFRERLLKADRANAKILGPCQHSEKCPVHRTKHWCHFSEPVTEGRLIDLNLRIFKDPRSWLKFSYILVRRDAPVEWDKTKFRAIGDLHPSGPKRMAIDLCQPNEKFALTIPGNIPPELRSTLVRGATVWVDADRQVTARPLTKREVKFLPEKKSRPDGAPKSKPRHNPFPKNSGKKPGKRPAR